MVKSTPMHYRQVVEHAVLLNLPYLQGDQESQILRALYNLQFEFDTILQLSVGRVLDNQNLVTHALILRFPSIQVLLDYYQSNAHSNAFAKIGPHLHGQYTVDYLASVHDYGNGGSVGPKWINLTFLNFKDNLLPGTTENVVQSLFDLGGQLDYVIKDLTVGENLVIQDGAFSHAFGVYLSSAEDLERLPNNPRYASVINDKVVPAAAKLFSVRFLAFKPFLTARL